MGILVCWNKVESAVSNGGPQHECRCKRGAPRARHLFSRIVGVVGGVLAGTVNIFARSNDGNCDDRGWEWLITPLMVYQNYHLIHHLYLNVPFYNHLKNGHLKYGELVAERPAVQSAFGLMPLKRAR